jgi:hypothetical protein
MTAMVTSSPARRLREPAGLASMTADEVCARRHENRYRKHGGGKQPDAEDRARRGAGDGRRARAASSALWT